MVASPLSHLATLPLVQRKCWRIGVHAGMGPYGRGPLG